MKYKITSNQFERLISLEHDLRTLAMDAIESRNFHAKAMNTLATEFKALILRIEMQDVEE